MANTQTSELPPGFIGYAGVGRFVGVTRRTIEREVQRGNLPRPMQLTPGKMGWPIALIQAHYNKKLLENSVAQVEDLEPDQLDDQAINLVAKSISLRTGEKVEVADLDVQVSRGMSEESFEEAEQQEFAAYSERFSDFSLGARPSSRLL